MSNLPKVSIDLPIVLNPYKFSMILSGLDKNYSEIMIPNCFEFIEVWTLQMMPVTLYTFQEHFEKMDYLDFGLNPNAIEPNNFIAGLHLLQMAHKKGMVTLFDSSKYQKDGLEFLGTEKVFSDFYSIQTSDARWNLNPDYGSITLEGMLGYELNNDTKAIFGDIYFANYLKSLKIYENVKTSENLDHDRNVDLLFKYKKGTSTEELFNYLSNKDFYETTSNKLYDTDRELNKFNDNLFKLLEFGSTLAADSYLFNGLPFGSGAFIVYQMGQRLFEKKKS